VAGGAVTKAGVAGLNGSTNKGGKSSNEQKR